MSALRGERCNLDAIRARPTTCLHVAVARSQYLRVWREDPCGRGRPYYTVHILVEYTGRRVLMHMLPGSGTQRAVGLLNIEY